MTLDTIDRIYDQEMERFEYQLHNGIISLETYDQEVRELDKWARDAEEEILS